MDKGSKSTKKAIEDATDTLKKRLGKLRPFGNKDDADRATQKP